MGASPASTPRRRAARQTGDGRSYSTAARPWKTSHGSCTKTSRARSGTRAYRVQPDSADSRGGASIRGRPSTHVPPWPGVAVGGGLFALGVIVLAVRRPEREEAPPDPFEIPEFKWRKPGGRS